MTEYEDFMKLDTDKKLEALYVVVTNIERLMRPLAVDMKNVMTGTGTIYEYLRKNIRVDKGDPIAVTVKEAETEESPFNLDVGPPTRSELEDALGGEMSQLDYVAGGLEIRPLVFLGDAWSNINQILTANNYEWIRDGKNSHWRFQSSDETTTPKLTESEEERLEGYDDEAKKIIKTIQEQKPNLTVEAIANLIQEERTKAAGLLTTTAATYLVATNIGVSLDGSKVKWVPTRDEVANITGNWKVGKYGKYTFSKDYPDLVDAIKESYQERLDYGNFYFKLGGDSDDFINMSERKFNVGEPPSDAQLKYAKSLGIKNPEGMDKGSLSVAMANVQLADRRK